MKKLASIARAALARVKGRTGPIARDLLGAAGLGCIAAGIGMIHYPSGLIAAGVEMSAVAWMLARSA